MHEEFERISLLEKKKHDYVKRWVVLRDCWLYLFTDEGAVTQGRNADHVVSVNLRGSLCQRHPEMQRTFTLESSALFTISGQRHVYVIRANSEEVVEGWLNDINKSAIWDMVLRATADAAKKKARKKKVKASKQGDDDTSSVASSRLSRVSRSSARTGTSAGSAKQNPRVEDRVQQRPKLEEIQESSPAAGGQIAFQQGGEVQREPEREDASRMIVEGILMAETEEEEVDVGRIHISVQPDHRRTADQEHAATLAPATMEVPLHPMKIEPSAAAARNPYLAAKHAGASANHGTPAKEGSRVLGAPVFAQRSTRPGGAAALPSLSRPLPAAVAERGGRKAEERVAEPEPVRVGSEHGEGGGARSEEGGSEHKEDEEVLYPEPDLESASRTASEEEESESEAEEEEAEPSSADSSEEERKEEERKQFFNDAYCLRGSDSEDDLADLDQRLEPRDAYEERVRSVRRVRRFYRRRVMAYGVPYSWGNGHNFCLGHGASRDERFPTQLKALRKKGVVQMAVGKAHCLALTASGQVYSWGVGMFGRLGQADMRDGPTPRVIGVTKKDFGDRKSVV